jgi:hypothetical protein
MSMTMCNLIDKQIGEDKLSSELFAPLCKIIGKVDRLVDIFNETQVNDKNVPKGCENVNSPSHRHIEEVLDILPYSMSGALRQRQRRTLTCSFRALPLTISARWCLALLALLRLI